MVNHEMLKSLGSSKNPAPSPFPKPLMDIFDYSPSLKLQHYFTKSREPLNYDRLFTDACEE